MEQILELRTREVERREASPSLPTHDNTDLPYHIRKMLYEISEKQKNGDYFVE